MKKAMVYGAGVSGYSAKKLLEANNYSVIMVDDKSAITSEEALDKLSEIEIFVKSPGIPYNKLVKEVINKKIELIDEIELAYRYMNKNIKIIGITGTNGKTTTTAKLKELIEKSGKKVEYAGNIGIPYSKIVLENKKLDYVVLELSSYQLENIKEFKPDIAIIINLSPDHLNRYESLDQYYDAKFNIVKNLSEGLFIKNIDDREILKRSEKIKNFLNISLEKNQNADYFIDKDFVIENIGENTKNKILEISKLNLKGIHNLQNILFITAVARKLKIEEKIIQEFLYNTKPLEHRMEEFYEVEGVKFINDSKGTNVDSTIKAINAFEKKMILICGGKDKKVNLIPLAKVIKSKIDKVYLIGETSNILEELLLNENYPKEKIRNLGTLKKVIDELSDKEKMNKIDIVLFSPAHSSFDQFKNFEIRGKIFKKLVKEEIK